MAFDYNKTVQKLRNFRIKNVRIDEGFDLKTKRIRGMEILAAIKGRKLLLACTDERPVKEILDPQTSESKDPTQYALVRTAGGAMGLVDAVRNVRVTIQRGEILTALNENEVVIANHIDTHAQEGELTGCGYGNLRAYTESGSIFDRPPVDLQERIASFEEMGVLRVVLGGEHTAEGLVINTFYDKVLDPNLPGSANSFFSLDLGIYRNIMHWIEGALGFGEEAMRTMLVKLARDTLAAVFILTSGEINEAVYIELADSRDQFFTGVVHEGLGELKEREGPVMHLLEERMGGI